MNGTSFCGSFISSPAALGSSKPTKLKNSTGTAAMKIPHVGLKSPVETPCTPWSSAYRTTVSVKPPSTAIRTKAPIVGIHLPMPKDRIAAHTANQMKASENRYFQMPVSGVKKSPNVVTARIVSVPPSQIGFESQ